MNDYVLGQPQPPRMSLGARFAAFGLVVAIVVGLLTTRIFYLQVVQGGYYAGLAEENRQQTQPIRSARGLIYDRAGRPLAINIPSYVVRIRPADLPFGQRDAVVERLSSLLHVPATDIIESLDRYASLRFELVRIASDVPSDVARIIVEESRSLPGVEVDVEERRQYEYGALVSHVLGYTGAVTAEDLLELEEIGYLNDDQIGKTGVEATFEEELRGAYGSEQVERDSGGRVVRTVQILDDPQPGTSLELTLDIEVQQEAEEALRWATEVVDLQRGVVIVMNPQTGEILALVSLPNYDNNLFARGISNTDYQALVEDPNRPLVNFALSEQYPPGSTYKLVTAVGALEDGLVNPSTVLETGPFLEIGTYKYWEWNRRGFGPLDISGGFAHSSDTFFYQLAGGLGIDRLAHWATEFGFGQRTGVDLPAEARGIVPTNEWKQSVFGQDVFPGEVYQAGIGQGYDAATPLQVLNSFNALANGGSLLKPQIVRRVLAPDGSVVRSFQPELIRQLGVSPDTLRTMRLAAHEVVTSGHTYNLNDLPLVVAGKTGTAEFGLRDSQGRLPFHSWFAAFVPQFGPDQPGDPAQTDSELAIVAFAYDSNTKGNAATEIVKYFLQDHYDLGVDLTRPDLLQRGNFYGGH
ncbi:MAG TPA: penicillin-binding protein 2 [Candidatus Limnocylindrales bacterium]|nr:penicillin-binding protein 2 [Candidatus Limnocylindrales bacterium]